jgi:hypothetical protein|nr:MAG TPA: hypothetical protein [Caudoviricetes sp.]
MVLKQLYMAFENWTPLTELEIYVNHKRQNMRAGEACMFLGHLLVESFNETIIYLKGGF